LSLSTMAGYHDFGLSHEHGSDAIPACLQSRLSVHHFRRLLEKSPELIRLDIMKPRMINLCFAIDSQDHPDGRKKSA
jgi:hypothetical protein